MPDTIFDGREHSPIDVKVTINGHTYQKGDLLQRFRMIGNLYSQNTFGIGGCCSRELQFGILLDGTTIPKQARIDVSMKLNTGYWFRKGTFYIDTRKNVQDKFLEITAYDGMLKAEADFVRPSASIPYIKYYDHKYLRYEQSDEDGASYPWAWKEGDLVCYTVANPQVDDSMYYDAQGTSWYRVVTEVGEDDVGTLTMEFVAYYIANQICDGLDSRCSFEDYEFDLDGQYSQREVLSIIATAHGGNFIITDENKLLLVKEQANPTSDFTLDDTVVQNMDIEGMTYTISKLELYGSPGTFYSGDDTGVSVRAWSDMASQEMCDTLISQLSGITYRPYSGRAMIPPTCELGNHFTYNGNLYTLCDVDFTFNNVFMCDISAPGDGDIEHEYKYESAQSRRLSRSINEKLDTENGVFGGAGLQVKSSQQSTINKLVVNELSATELTADTGAFNSIDITPGIEIDTYLVGSTVQRTITFTATPNCSLSGDYINYEVTISSSYALPGNVSVSATVSIALDFGGSSPTRRQTTITGIMPSGATAITLAVQDYYKGIERFATLQSSGTVTSYTPQSKTFRVPSGGTRCIQTNAGILPAFDGSLNLGDSTRRWQDVYAVNVNQSSDKRLKEDISANLKAYDKVFDKLKPVSFKVKQSDGKVHLGFIAQDIIKALKEQEIEDSAIVCVDDILSLRYTEFIALNTYEIQKLKSRVAELEKRLS